ncbi:MAG: hypothetical protein AAFV53_34145 [Myxococcota bacterium]
MIPGGKIGWAVTTAASVLGSGFIYRAIQRRRSRNAVSPETESGPRFFEVHGVQVTCGEVRALNYIDVHGIRVTRQAPPLR